MPSHPPDPGKTPRELLADLKAHVESDGYGPRSFDLLLQVTEAMIERVELLERTVAVQQRSSR